MKDPWGCSACGRKFSSLTGFDKHRFGKYVDVHPHYGRDCHDDAWMLERGWTCKDGVWRTPKSKRAAEFFERKRQEAKADKQAGK